MAANIAAALDEAEKVVKKQRTCAAQTGGVLAKLLGQLQRAQAAAAADSGAGQAALRAAAQAVAEQDMAGSLSRATKDLHGSVAKLGKALEKAFIQDVAAAYRDVPMDPAVLDRVIAEHLFQSGAFEAGDALLAEAGIPDGRALRAPYEAMHAILRQIQALDLGPALRWAAGHRAQLAQAFGRERAEAFEFKLHRLQFTHLLQQQGQAAALAYARQHFARFQASQLTGIQQAMGCLCYLRRPGNPYAQLLAPQRWADAERDFSRHCCSLLGQASESPLLVATAAGAAALPTLLKLAGLLRERAAAELAGGEQLPVELSLGPEFVFRSIFSCPVSREQASPANPPMLLPCGHVLCKHSILKIAKSASRAFKCPYCPLEASLATCTQLFFPPML